MRTAALFPLFFAVVMACGGDLSTDSSAASSGTTTGQVTGAVTGATTGASTGAPGTSARAAIYIDVGADGTAIGDAASPGDLCPNSWTWYGVILGAAQCLSPGSSSAVGLISRPDGVAVTSGVPPAEICPPGWVFRGQGFTQVNCTLDGEGTVITATPCPSDTTELGFAFNPQGFCHRPQAGTWFYVWYNADGEKFDVVAQPSDMCPADFVVDGIGCYRAGPGAVVEISASLSGVTPSDNDTAAALCPEESTYVGADGEFVWANCLYPNAITSVDVVENAQGRTLGTGATPDELCPDGFVPVGLSGLGVVCVSS